MFGKNKLQLTSILLLAILAGCNQPDKFQTEFERNFPKPDWFETLDAPSLSSAAEVSDLWKSEKRSGGGDAVKRGYKIMYKSCYNAIYEHYTDQQLVARCVPKMISAAKSEQRSKLLRFLVENYPEHKKDVTRCSSCMEADTIARSTLSLARYAHRSDKTGKESIRLIEDIMDRRKNEISPWVQGEMFEFLGKLYLETTVTPDAKKRFLEVHKKLNAEVKSKSMKQWRLKNFEKVYKPIMAN